MSLSRLKEELLRINRVRERLLGAGEYRHRRIFENLFREGVRLTDDAFLSGDGHIYVEEGGKQVKYTVEKFFIHHKLSRREVSEALRRVEDISLAAKLEEGTLKAIEIIRCRNILIRQYLLERYGYENFLKELKCIVIHRDGDNELIMIPMGREEEPIMLVKVKDPSTGLIHLLRVPPTMRTCREAITWTFGMTGEEYNPIVET